MSSDKRVATTLRERDLSENLCQISTQHAPLWIRNFLDFLEYNLQLSSPSSKGDNSSSWYLAVLKITPD